MSNRCYAASLGGCNKISDEHVVSRGLFGDAMLGTRGMPFPEDKLIHVDRIVAKILCRKHNEALTALDAEIIKLGTAALEMRRQGSSVSVSVDGNLVERWLLKCAIGSAASGWFGAKVYPKPAMVRALYGHIPLPENVTMFGVADVSRMIGDRDGVSTSRILDTARPDEMGWLVSVHGIPLLLSVCLADPQGTLRKSKPVDMLNVQTARCDRHPPYITMESPQQSATLIATLRWND